MKKNLHKARIDANYKYIPNLNIPTDDGEEINNRELPVGEQITVTIKRAKQVEIDKYRDIQLNRDMNTISRATLDYDNAVLNHVKTVTGMESIDITDGKSLLKMETQNSVARDLIVELYNEIMEPESSSEKGGLNEGE